MVTRVVDGRYRLTRLLGRGGMGAVWLAEDPLAGRQVAIKELRAPAGLPGHEREAFTRRCLQEARSAARIHHPGAVTLFNVIPASADDDAIYLVMEYVDGMTLGGLVERDGRLDEGLVTAIAVQLLAVLEAAHALGVVHRDIKPANVMITGGGQAKLADFGIAYIMGGTRLTGSGVMGTPAYMAPEMFETGEITPAVDLWSLGATLYHAAEGRDPFGRESAGTIMRAILLDPLPVPQCSPPLSAAISGMLQRDPAQRIGIPSARALLTGAAQLPAGPGGTERDPGPGTAGPPRRIVLATERATGLGEAFRDASGRPSMRAQLMREFRGDSARCARFESERQGLVIGPTGIQVLRGGGLGRAWAGMRWQEISRIGRVTDRKGRVYLCAWGTSAFGAILPDRPTGLCLLDEEHFPFGAIRAAILASRPTVNLDPM